MADHTSIVLAGDDLLAEVAATRLEPGQLGFWWFGQLTYLLKFGTVTALIDPYLQPNPRRNKPPLLTPAQCSGIDVILCTHDHTDHIDPWAIPQLVAETKATFVAPRALAGRMAELQVPAERLVALNADETVTVSGLEVNAVASAHEFLSPTPEGLHPYLGYVVRGNGVSIYHSGDTVWWEGLQGALADLLPIDVAFVPINGRDGARYRRGTIGNMNFAEACDLVCMLPVGLAVPAHFDMFEGNLADPLQFTDYCEAKYHGQRWWLGAGGERVVVAAGGGLAS